MNVTFRYRMFKFKCVIFFILFMYYLYCYLIINCNMLKYQGTIPYEMQSACVEQQ